MQSGKRSVALGGRDNEIIDADDPALEDLGDDTALFGERFPEITLAGELARTQTGVAVLDAPQLRVADFELLAHHVDELEELVTVDNEVAATVDILESGSPEETAPNQGDLTPTNVALVETTLTGAIPVPLEALASDGPDLLNQLHWRASSGRDADCHDFSFGHFLTPREWFA